jgi:hypothetical protein
VTKDTYPYVMEAVTSIVLGAAYLFVLLLMAGVSLFLVPLVLLEAGIRRACLITKDAISE